MFTLYRDERQTGHFLAKGFLLGWLLLPNIALLLVYNETLVPLPVFLLILPVVSLLYFYSFPSLKWFAWFNLPFALVSGFYAAYIIEFHGIPYEGMWFSVWDMVYFEFFDLGRYYLEVFVVSLCGFAFYLWCLWSVRKTRPVKRAQQKPVLLVCLVVVLALFAGQNFFSSRSSFIDQDYGGAFIQSFPLGMVLQAHSTWQDSKQQKTVEVSSIPDLERITSPLAE